MQFTIKDTIIGMPETPFILRVNKQSGCFAIGGIEAGNAESYATYGRGKSLEIALVKCDTNLSGRVSKLNKEDEAYTFVSGIVVSADDKRLPKGLLTHFLVKGYEAQFFNILAMETETALIFGEKLPAQVLKIVFDKKIQTQYKSTIQPPTISVRNASKAELPLCEAAEMILADYPQYLPDATELYATAVDDHTGEVVKGLNRMRDVMAISGANDTEKLLKSIPQAYETLNHHPGELTENELTEIPY